jgi:hypothetical protein
METNIKLIENKIKSIPGTDNFIKKAKVQRLQFYKDNLSRVNQMQAENINQYNFKVEVINHAYNLRKSALLPKIIKQVIKLEAHSFAPELNKLHFTKNRFISVPGKIDIATALTFLINTMSLDQLIELTK